VRKGYESPKEDDMKGDSESYRQTERSTGWITHDTYSMIFSMVESNSYDYIMLVLYNIVTIYEVNK
jgi:hypothetical protein